MTSFCRVCKTRFQRLRSAQHSLWWSVWFILLHLEVLHSASNFPLCIPALKHLDYFLNNLCVNKIASILLWQTAGLQRIKFHHVTTFVPFHPLT